MIEFLGTETDKTGSQLNIYRVDRIALSPIYTFFLRQIADLIDSGYAFPVTSWDDDCGAVYAEKDGEILGHIVYDRKKKGILWITLSAVDPKCRGQGIYSILHQYFEQTAKEMGCNIIASHVHIKNEKRLKSAEKVGMKPVYYYMAKKLTS